LKFINNSTISTTITKLWKENQLVKKKILPENQRMTVVSLTPAGEKVLREIRQAQTVTFKAVTKSLGLSSEQDAYFQIFIKNGIQFFDKRLGLKLDELAV
jgi:DNA-binding MarR family transcriptional regulator